MSEFRTEIHIPESNQKIRPSDSIGLIGSCFAEHIANKLYRSKFAILKNPFGILYNPLSIKQYIQHVIEKKSYSSQDLVEQDGIYCHFEAHSRLNNEEPEQICENLNEAIQQSHQFLKKMNWIFLSYGTSFYYQLKSDGQVVANCHKFPADYFERKKLSVSENIEAISSTVKILKSFNPSIQIVFTISPVRHKRDGLIENQRSKACLINAIEHVVHTWPVYYFPSYEIMMDDLRDYRFYAKDLLHPSELAIDYIWEKFSDTYFSEGSKNMAARIEKILQSLEHKPFHPGSSKHQQFLKHLINKMKAFEKDFPDKNLSEEMLKIDKQLI